MEAFQDHRDSGPRSWALKHVLAYVRSIMLIQDEANVWIHAVKPLMDKYKKTKIRIPSLELEGNFLDTIKTFTI